MRALSRFLVVAGVIGALAGCAGTDFIRPSSSELQLGKTTYAQAVAKLGPPRREGSVLKNEQTLQTVTYAYASVGGTPHRQGVTAARAIGLYFHKGILVGHEFISSYAEDNTDFNDRRIGEIVRDRSRREEVVRLIGKPSGTYIYPLIREPTGEADVYAYVEVRGFTPYRKVLVVTFDGQGFVTDIEFNTHGTRSD